MDEFSKQTGELYVEVRFVGEKIAALRKSNGITQEKLAELIGVSRESIRRWEKNETSPSIENLRKIGMVLGASSGYFFSEENDVNKTETNAVKETTTNSTSDVNSQTAHMFDAHEKAIMQMNRLLRAMLIIVSILFTAAFFASSFMAVFTGLAFFTTNIGDEVVITSGANFGQFAVLTASSVIFLGLSIFSWIKSIKN